MVDRMIKVFGSTQYVRTDVSDSKLIGNFPDVKPFEPYLQFVVKSQWDFNPDGFYLEFKDGFSFYIVLVAKENNTTYHYYKKLRKEDIEVEWMEQIKKYLND